MSVCQKGRDRQPPECGASRLNSMRAGSDVPSGRRNGRKSIFPCRPWGRREKEAHALKGDRRGCRCDRRREPTRCTGGACTACLAVSALRARLLGVVTVKCRVLHHSSSARGQGAGCLMVVTGSRQRGGRRRDAEQQCHLQEQAGEQSSQPYRAEFHHHVTASCDQMQPLVRSPSSRVPQHHLKQMLIRHNHHARDPSKPLPDLGNAALGRPWCQVTRCS